MDLPRSPLLSLTKDLNIKKPHIKMIWGGKSPFHLASHLALGVGFEILVFISALADEIQE